MEASSIVSKARTAFHSAAAKAERVFTDIRKSDNSLTDRDVTVDSIGEDCDRKSVESSDSDSINNAGDSKSRQEIKYLTRKPAPLKTKQDWQERFKNFRIGRKGVEDFETAQHSTMELFDEKVFVLSTRDAFESKGSETGSSPERMTNTSIIPPASVLKQLVIAFEAGKKYKSMKDLLASSRDSSPVRERALSAVKSLMLRDKEDKFTAEFGGDAKVLSLLNSLLDAERQFPGRKTQFGFDTLPSMTSLPKDIHGAPPASFVVELSEVIGSLKTLRKMSLFWCKVVAELRRLWSEGQYVPGIPTDEIPDLNLCLLYQKLQVINCCISRKRRRSNAADSLESLIKLANSNVEQSAAVEGTGLITSGLYARISTEELVLRLGADKKSDNLTMLETGEPIYTPVVQEEPLLTEDLMRETEELVLRTGSVGAGCSQLLSDMQAFKAANPGCILEDFVRWHSPPDWTEMEPSGTSENAFRDGDSSCARGQLSNRMQKEGNLWRELWDTAKPIPAVKQAPLFDEDLAVEDILNDLEEIPPSELLGQLFLSLLGSGFVIAEEKLSTNSSFSKMFYECRDYILSSCQGSIWAQKVDDICQVYETVEMMLLKPEEVMKMGNQPGETTPTASEPRRRFKKLSAIFGNSGKPSKEQKYEDTTTTTTITAPPRESISSIFSKKPPRPDALSAADKPVSSVDNGWTVV
ncbi:uncharacterized protein LOC127792412 [Diospyros lotus]|uniref:uncharacterized protein LOC127792412 n=1 Tax=Diospyros lotus TaxID=55363 RepID=UPI0022505A6F|nr:uncharacterized protein LOC127792412 [Diospyros lotus]